MDIISSIFRELSSIELVFFTTNKCSGVCPYCFVKKVKDGHQLREISATEVDLFLRFATKHSNRRELICYWQGAEATELSVQKWKKIDEVVQNYKKSFKLKNILVSGLFTNVDTIINVIDSFHFDLLSYSIDPLRGIHHHKIVAQKIEKIRQKTQIEVVNSCIVVLSNAVHNHEFELIEQYQKYNIKRIRLRELVPRSKQDECVVKNNVLLEMYKRFFEIYLHSEISFDPFESFLYEWRYNKPYGTCCFFKGCGNLLSLRPRGEISACDLSGELSQNLVFGTFEDLNLVQKNIEIWRNRRPEKCISCKFEKVCNGGCPARAHMMSSIQVEDSLCEVWYALREFAYEKFSKLSYDEIQKLWKKSNFANIKYQPKFKVY